MADDKPTGGSENSPINDVAGAMAPGALSGLRVLDLSRILAGPFTTQLMGDLGADVWKVERPHSGDDTRRWGPHYATDATGKPTQESAYFLSANRNKRSLAIDLQNPAGAALVRQLAAEADVLVENFKVGGLKKYALDYDSLKESCPRLVYCSITGFGQSGPYKDRPGYDFLAQGMGGLMSLSGESNGEPMKTGVGIADVMCGMYASTAILAALRHRDLSGQGQWIDMSLLDSQIGWLVNEGSNYLTSGEVPMRLGNAHPNIVPYQVFATRDGHFILAVGNDGQFRRFCEHAGLDMLPDDVRYATNDARIENRDRLAVLISEKTRQKTTAEWISLLETASVPAGPVNDLSQVFDDPQVRHREMAIEMAHSPAGGQPVRLAANPIKMGAGGVSYRLSPPGLGQHTDEVLMEVLALSPDKLAELRKKGALG